jgi:hypothetical protein
VCKSTDTDTSLLALLCFTGTKVQALTRYSELGEECARVMGVLNARIHVSGASGKVIGYSTYAHVCSRLFDVCSRMLTYAQVCSGMLTYALSLCLWGEGGDPHR